MTYVRNTHLVQQIEDLLLAFIGGFFDRTSERLSLIGNFFLLLFLHLSSLHLLFLLTLTLLLLEVLILLDGDASLDVSHSINHSIIQSHRNQYHSFNHSISINLIEIIQSHSIS